MRRAQQDSTGRRRGAPAVLGLGIAALLTVAACGSGQIAQTSGMPPAVDGGHGQAGQIAVRNAAVAFPATGSVYPSQGDAPLVLTIVNSGDMGDTLVSVTSSVSTGPATITGATDLPPGASLVAGQDLIGRPSSSAGAEATTTESSATTTTGGATTTGSSSSSGTATTTTTTLATPLAPVTVGQVSIVLTHLTTVVRSGQSIDVTLNFAKAGPVTVTLPVAAPGGTPTETPNATP